MPRANSTRTTCPESTSAPASPRLIAVDVPGRGRKVCWYMWYQVTNNTSEPRFFVPEFELVTHDVPKNPVFRDQVLPTVQP